MSEARARSTPYDHSPFTSIEVHSETVIPVKAPRKPKINTHEIAPRTSIDLLEVAKHTKDHNAILFRDRVFSDEDWKKHLSWTRYLPEPVITCVHVLHITLLQCREFGRPPALNSGHVADTVFSWLWRHLYCGFV